MKLTIIGCWGGYPKENEASAGYLLEQDDFSLLIDCGSAVLSKLQRVIAPEDLDAVIISHYHADHMADIGVLQHARYIQGFLKKVANPLPIYGHGNNETEFAKLTYKDITVGVEYDPEKPLQVGPFTIHFLKTSHPVDCFAMRIIAGNQTVVYTADTAYTEELVAFSHGANVLLSECNFYGQQNVEGAGHMNSFEAGNLAEKACVGELILTHLPHYGDQNKLVQEANQYYKGKTTLAYSGQVIYIS